MTQNSDAQIRHVYDEWHRAINAHDLGGLMALYADDAVLETPTILALFKDRSEGILRGKSEIEKLFAAVLRSLSSDFRELYRTEIFLANGQLLMWEYPRATPNGEQVDLIESMDIANGLIIYHRVYWGWKGFKSLLAAMGRPR